MTKKRDHDKKAVIVAEWRALPADQRKTEAQAASFAMSAVQRHSVRTSGDAYQEVKSWLTQYTGMP
jgi:hypothetical protein